MMQKDLAMYNREVTNSRQKSTNSNKPQINRMRSKNEKKVGLVVNLTKPCRKVSSTFCGTVMPIEMRRKSTLKFAPHLVPF